MENNLNDENNPLQIYLSLSIIGILLISFCFIGSTNNYKAYLQDVEWNFKEGDKIYYGFYDKYTHYNKSSIQNFTSLFKTSVLKVQDLTIDNDAYDDLVLLSSLMIGDDTANFQLPLLFDVYHLTSLLGLVLPTTNQSGSGYSLSIPSAMHSVLSSNYITLDQFTNGLPDFKTLDETIEDVPYFENMSQIISFAGSFVELDYPYYRFNTDNVSTIPKDFTWDSTDKENNSLGIYNHALANKNTIYYKVLRLLQNGNQISPNILGWNGGQKVLNVSNEAWDENVPYNIDFKFQTVSFYYQHDFTDPDLETIINFSFPYDFVAFKNGLFQRFKGVNGMILKIKGETIYNYIGDYLWNEDTDSYYSAGSLTRTWYPIGTIDPELTRNNLIKFILNFGKRSGALVIQDFFKGKEQIINPVQYHMEKIDNEMLLHNKEVAFEFYPYNFYNFQLSQNSPYFVSTTYFDNFDFALNGSAISFKNQSKTYGINDPFSNDLFSTISIYNLLFFPNDFDLHGFRKYFDFVNWIWRYFAEILDIYPRYVFTIEENAKIFRASITSNILRQFYETILMLFGNPSVKFMLGEWSGNLTIAWDKQAHLFKELIVTISYEELRIRQEAGFKLIATTMPNDVYPSKLPAEYSLLANLDINDLAGDYLNETKSDLLKRAYIAIPIIALGSCIFGIGITELIRYYRKKRLEK